MGLNDNIRRRVGDAGENEAGFDLFVVEEAAVGLVDAAFHHLSGAGRARTRPARVRKIDPFLLRLVQDVDVVGAVELLGSLRGYELHLVDRHGRDSSAASAALHAEQGLAHLGECPEGGRRLPPEEGGADHGAGESGGGGHWGGRG